MFWARFLALVKDDTEYLHGGVLSAQLFSVLQKASLGLLRIATSSLDEMTILFVGWFVKTDLGDKLGPPKLSTGVHIDSCADAVTVYARDDMCLSTL